MTNNTQWVIEGDNSLVAYADPFAGISEDSIVYASDVEQTIINIKQGVTQGFVVMANYLDIFETQKLYLTRGYETMKAWCESPEIDMSYRMVKDLMRIRRELLPALSEHYPAPEQLVDIVLKAGISKTRALLPLLRDENTRQQLPELAHRASSMPHSDLVAEVKAARGEMSPIEQRSPAVFFAQAEEGSMFYRVKITCSDGIDTYQVGTLLIKPEHFARWDVRFGSLITYTKAHEL